jgi:hypothetical protein
MKQPNFGDVKASMSGKQHNVSLNVMTCHITGFIMGIVFPRNYTAMYSANLVEGVETKQTDCVD